MNTFKKYQEIHRTSWSQLDISKKIHPEKEKKYTKLKRSLGRRCLDPGAVAPQEAAAAGQGRTPAAPAPRRAGHEDAGAEIAPGEFQAPRRSPRLTVPLALGWAAGGGLGEPWGADPVGPPWMVSV